MTSGRTEYIAETKAMVVACDNVSREIAQRLVHMRDVFEMSQTEIGKAMDKSQAWVSFMLRWRDGGFTETPFGPAAKAARERKVISQTNEPPAADHRQVADDGVEASTQACKPLSAAAAVSSEPGNVVDFPLYKIERGDPDDEQNDGSGHSEGEQKDEAHATTPACQAVADQGHDLAIPGLPRRDGAPVERSRDGEDGADEARDVDDRPHKAKAEILSLIEPVLQLVDGEGHCACQIDGADRALHDAVEKAERALNDVRDEVARANDGAVRKEIYAERQAAEKARRSAAGKRAAATRKRRAEAA